MLHYVEKKHALLNHLLQKQERLAMLFVIGEKFLDELLEFRQKD